MDNEVGGESSSLKKTISPVLSILQLSALLFLWAGLSEILLFHVSMSIGIVRTSGLGLKCHW